MKLIKGLFLFYILFSVFYLRAQAPYCLSYAGSDGTYDITNISITQGASTIFTNASTCGALTSGPGSMIGRYSNYRFKTINLVKGQTYTINVTHSACSGIFNRSTLLAMFLDLNKNYVFDTPSEKLIWTAPMTVLVGGSIVLSANFTIPSSTSIDSTVMRVITAVTTSFLPNTCADLINGFDYTGGETEDYTVTFCEPVTRNLTVTHPKCAGQLTGKIKVSTTGGVNPKTYAWSGGAYSSVDSIYNQAAGIYTLITKDSLGCKYYDTILITQPSPLVLNKTVTNTCQRYLSGKIIASGLGGTPPYSYSINGSSFGTKNVWDTLPKGQYILELKDQNGCIKKDTVYIDTLPLNSYQMKQVDSIVCKHDAWLRYFFTDTSQYRFFGLDGGALVAGNNGIKVFTPLTSGIHIVKMVDKNNCNLYDTTTLAASPIVFKLKSKLDLGCNGTTQGKIVLETLNKKPGDSYKYNWSHIAVPFYNTFDSLSNLAVGSYKIKLQITAADGRICIYDSITQPIVNLGVSLRLGFSLLKLHKCIYDSLNVIKLNAIGGLAPFKYSIVESTVFPVTHTSWSSTDTLKLKKAYQYGTFNVGISIRDSNQCQFDTTLIFYPQSYANVIMLQKMPYGCGLSPTNQVYFEQYDHWRCTLPVLYSFNNSAYGTDSIFNNVVGNKKYIYKYKDAIGCEYFDSVYIFAGSSYTTTKAVTPNNCIGGAQGQVNILVTGGSAPIDYSINNGTYQSSNVFSGLVSGKYIIKTRDGTGCIVLDTVYITDPIHSLQNTLVNSNPCAGDSMAIAHVKLSGTDILGAVAYSLDNGAFSFTDTFKKLKAGIHSIRIQYNSLCMYTATVNVVDPSPLSLSLSSQSDISCFGANNGRITIAISGGTPPYKTYLNGILQSSQTNFTNLNSANYLVTVSDANQCIKTLAPISISEPAKLELVVSQVKPTSCGANKGEMYLDSKGGFGAKRLTINGVAQSIPQLIQNLAGGSYKLILTDGNNCKDSSNVLIGNLGNLQVSTQVKPISCFQAKDGEIKLQIKAGNPPFKYSWTDGSTSDLRQNLSPGKYYLSIQDSLNCQFTDSFEFIDPKQIKYKAQIMDAPCYNSYGMISLNISDGVLMPNSVYKLYLNNKSIFSTNYTIYLIQPDSYLLKIEDDNGCHRDTNIRIQAPPQIKVSLDSVYLLSKLGETLTIIPQILGSVSDLKYHWLPSSGLSCADCPQPIFNGYVTSRYKLIYQYNQDRCTDSAFTQIVVPNAPHETLFIPTAFSPNKEGDKENETFKIYGSFIKSIDLKVFNRWGEKVFETTDKEKGWNGIYLGEKAPFGIYSYTALIQFLDNTILEKAGSVTLIR